MKILHLIPHFLPSAHFGGTPIVCHQLAKHQSQLKHQVTVITTDVYSQFKRTSVNIKNKNSIDGYKVIRFKNLSNPLAYRFKFSTPIGLFSFLIKNLNKFDTVYLHEYRSTFNVIISLVLLFLYIGSFVISLRLQPIMPDSIYRMSSILVPILWISITESVLMFLSWHNMFNKFQS